MCIHVEHIYNREVVHISVVPDAVSVELPFAVVAIL